MSLIERRAGMKFERIGAPQPQDMARIAGERAAVAVKVSCWFAAAVSSYIQCVAPLGTERASALRRGRALVLSPLAWPCP